MSNGWYQMAINNPELGAVVRTGIVAPWALELPGSPVGWHSSADTSAGPPGVPMQSAPKLDDKSGREAGRVFLSGTQALVRLPLMQRARDAAAGLNTAGYISGYR